MSDSQDFDPRFDPAFQRGFEGEVTTTRRRGLSGAPSAVPVADNAAPVPVAAPAPTPVSAPQAVVLTEEQPAVEVEPAIARRRFITGWTIAIAVIAVLLILGGGYGINQLIEALAAADQQATPNFYVVLLGVFASPLAIALGIASIVGLLFLGAVRRR